MKVKNGQILEATKAELESQWKKGEWDTVYSFDEYLRIQTEENGIVLIEEKND